tara:strand:- start:8300 stop:9355 length:1056 start_codon:yes stop_codon:yes gene_type:complete
MRKNYKNFLVTGGMGFIGSNFIKFMLKQDEVVSIVNIDNLSEGSCEDNLAEERGNEKLYFYNKSIKDDAVATILEDHNIDCLVHFAAESHVDRSILNPNSFVETNVNGTLNLLNHSLSYAKNKKHFHFHHVSTDEVYGSLSVEEPAFTEENQYMPNSPYSASKAGSDHLVRAWHHTFGLNTTTSNCSNNYGPNQFPEKLIPVIIKSALQGKLIPIYGSGENIRDWLYVDDHCEAIYKIIHEGKFGETYNVGGKNEITNIEIVKTICELLDEMCPVIEPSPYNGIKLDISSYSDLIEYVEDRLGHDFRYSINPKKIEEEIKWFPKESFTSGINKTIAWYLANLNWLKNLDVK